MSDLRIEIAREHRRRAAEFLFGPLASDKWLQAGLSHELREWVETGVVLDTIDADERAKVQRAARLANVIHDAVLDALPQVHRLLQLLSANVADLRFANQTLRDSLEKLRQALRARARTDDAPPPKQVDP